MMQDLVVSLVFIGYAIGVLMTFGLVLTWVERKQGAVMSDRIGADRTYSLQIAPLDAGLLIVFAFGGLTVIGAMLAGWSSANKFSLLGALRAGSQMISYELIMGLTVLGLIVVYGTVNLDAIVRQQSGVVLGFLPAWGIFYQPFAALLFITAATAENKRIPFDLPEAESELIAGYFTEYSAM